MSQFTLVPGDTRLVEHIIGELKSKGIFDQFRKECIADVDTKPAYQNLRLRVEGSVSNYLSRQRWRPDLNKNQLREKLRKHIHEANYLEQGVERIVDQVVNPKVASVFIPQVEDLVYSVLGIQKPKSSQNSHSSKNEMVRDQDSPVDTATVSFENNDKEMEVSKEEKPEYIEMDVDEPEIQPKNEQEESSVFEVVKNSADIPIPFPDGVVQDSNDSRKVDIDKQVESKEELIVTTELSNLSIDIPLPDDPPKILEEESSESKQTDTETSLDSVIMRNVSPLTPIRSFNDENSCDAQPAFDEVKGVVENSGSEKVAEAPIPLSTFRFTIEKDCEESNFKSNKKVNVETPISYPYGQDSINNYSAPTYDDSSSSNNLHIDYQSDKDGAQNFDSKNDDTKQEIITQTLNDDQSKSKDTNYEDKKKSHKSAHSSKDTNRHSSSSKHSKDRKSDSKYHSGDKKESIKSDKKSSKDDTSHGKSRNSSHRDKSKERSDRDKKESGDKKEKSDSSKERQSSSYKSSSSNKNSKYSKHSSSSSRHHSSSNTKNTDEKKSSTSKSDDKKSDKEHRSSSKSSRDHSRQSSSHRSDKDKYKSSSSKDKEIKKDDKKDKKVTDDHYSASGRGNRTRRSTDRDSNDGNSSSSKGSTLISSAKTANATADNKSSTSKSDNQSNGSDSTSQSDAVENVQCDKVMINKIVDNVDQNKPLKPVLKLDSKLKTPVVESSQLPSVPEVQVRKPMIAANINEVFKLIKVRKQLALEQEKKRQEAALLIEFQQKIHSSVSQVYSGISGPELEFACFQKDAKDDKVNEKLLNVCNTEKCQEISIDVNENGVSKTLENCQVQNDNVIIDNTKEIDTEDEYLNFVYGDPNKELDVQYFSQQEIHNAKFEQENFAKFLESLEKVDPAKTIFLLNCDVQHELVLRKLCQEMIGDCKIVNFNQAKPKSYPSKLNTQDVVKNELSLPLENTKSLADVEGSDGDSNPSFFSPNVSSECSFDAPVDYDNKVNDVAQAKCYGRQEVLEIILGGLATDFEMKPSSVEGSTEKDVTNKVNLKRKHNGLVEENRTDNNNHKVLMPNKLRRLSLSETISSTTEADEPVSSTPTNKISSKFIGKVRRVGLPKPKNNKVSMSPLSDQSVENYVQNSQNDKTSPKLNGNFSVADKPSKNKLAQRYDTSDLYKPKLHYLSKRHSQVN